MLPGGRTTPKAPSLSDPVDPDLGFPPEHPDRVHVTCNDKALRRKRHQRHRHRPPRPQSDAVFTGSRVVPISRLARTVRSFAIKTYVAAGTPPETLHPFTGALIALPTIHVKNQRRIWMGSRSAAATMHTIASTTSHGVVGCHRPARELPWTQRKAPSPRCPSRLE